jgi:hypothetical protein
MIEWVFFLKKKALCINRVGVWLFVDVIILVLFCCSLILLYVVLFRGLLTPGRLNGHPCQHPVSRATLAAQVARLTDGTRRQLVPPSLPMRMQAETICARLCCPNNCDMWLWRVVLLQHV